MTETSFLVQRAVGRVTCLAEVEVIAVDKRTTLAAIISNFSSRGCYVDTQDGFPVGTVLRLRVHRPGRTFEVCGKAIHKRSGFGMGVAFDEMTAEQRAPIDAWIAELEHKMNSDRRPPQALDKALPYENE